MVASHDNEGVVSDCNLEQAQELLRLMHEKGLREEQFKSLISRGFLGDLFEAATTTNLGNINRSDFRIALGLPGFMAQVRVVVIGEFIIPEDITTIGDFLKSTVYGSVHPEITRAQFQAVDHNKRLVSMVQVIDKETITTERMRLIVSRLGKELALMEHLLWVGSHISRNGVQPSFPIVCLESPICFGDTCGMLVLNSENDECVLDLAEAGRNEVEQSEWNQSCRFLVMDSVPLP